MPTMSCAPILRRVSLSSTRMMTDPTVDSQTGSVLGVALFGSLIGQDSTFLFGLRAALIISALLLGAAATIAIVASLRRRTAR
jgi:predicted membrane protein